MEESNLRLKICNQSVDQLHHNLFILNIRVGLKKICLYPPGSAEAPWGQEGAQIFFLPIRPPKI